MMTKKQNLWIVALLLSQLINAAHSSQSFGISLCSGESRIDVPEDIDQKILLNDENFTKNELTIYSVNPPHPTNWSNPRDMIKSVKKNAFSDEGYYEDRINQDGHWEKTFVKIPKHFIGHMSINLKCVGKKTIQTGMSSSGFEEIYGVLFEENGFGQLFKKSKGYFNTAQELEKEFELRKSKVGNLWGMNIGLTGADCEKLHEYLREFKACQIDKRYGGLDASPLSNEGAGCSAFAISFLQILKLVPELKDFKTIQSSDNESKESKKIFGQEWVREIHVPYRLMRNNDILPEVGFYGFVLFDKEAHWANHHEPKRSLRFFDPELFSTWVQNFNPGAFTHERLKYLGQSRTSIGKTKTLHFILTGF